jgi:hypothetical protein
MDASPRRCPLRAVLPRGGARGGTADNLTLTPTLTLSKAKLSPNPDPDPTPNWEELLMESAATVDALIEKGKRQAAGLNISTHPF